MHRLQLSQVRISNRPRHATGAKVSITRILLLKVFETSSHNKMRFGATFIILLGFFLFQCNGAPPKEVATQSQRGVNFTKEENELILQELSRLLSTKQELLSKGLWKHITDKHREKWLGKTPGFPQERSRVSLLRHFKSKMMSNTAELNINVPENLVEILRLDLNKPPLGNRHLYSPEEHHFIMAELLQPSCTGLYASSTWETIRKKHDEKRQDQTPGFVYERTNEGLRSYIKTLKDNGELPDEVKKKFWKTEKGTSPVFTNQEREFITKELLKPSCTNIFGLSTLDTITAEHRQRWEARIHGFENERTRQSIRSYMTRLKRSGLLPEEVMRKSRLYEKGASSSEPKHPNQGTVSEGANEESEDEE